MGPRAFQDVRSPSPIMAPGRDNVSQITLRGQSCDKVYSKKLCVLQCQVAASFGKSRVKRSTLKGL